MVQTKLIGEFDRSLSKLKPLMDIIGQIDCSIDHVGYRLYGLIEEEIGMVKRGGDL